MTGFDSPISKKNIKPSQQMRNFEIPDESEPEFNVEAAIRQPGMKQLNINELQNFQTRLNESQTPQQDFEASQVEQEIRQARELKRSGKEKISDGAKKRLESLLGMTRSQRIIDVGGVEFIIQTLSGKEAREAIMNASQVANLETPFEIRVQLLARSLVSIGGVDFTQFVGSSNIVNKLDFIESFDEHVLGRLHDEYLIMTAEAKKKFGVNNADEAKEVISDIKK